MPTVKPLQLLLYMVYYAYVSPFNQSRGPLEAEILWSEKFRPEVCLLFLSINHTKPITSINYELKGNAYNSGLIHIKFF